MSEHDPHDHNAGHPGPAYGPGPGYGGPGPWGWYPGYGAMGGYGPGPMGPAPGYMGPPGFGPAGPPPGYPGGPGYTPGEQAGPPGAGPGPSMEQLMEELSGGAGLGGLGKLLNFEDTEFWKGALVGAAAVLLLTNESVQQSLFKSGVKAKDAVEKGLGSLRRGASEAESDAEASADPAVPETAKTRKTRPTRKKKEPSS